MGLAFDQAGDLYVADPGNLATSVHLEGRPVREGDTGRRQGRLRLERQRGSRAGGRDPGRSDLPSDPVGTSTSTTRTASGRSTRPASSTPSPAPGWPGSRGTPDRRSRRPSGLSAPVSLGVAADGAGNVYLGDPSNFRIRKVDSGRRSSRPSRGPASRATRATEARPWTPPSVPSRRLAVDAAGDLYFADTGNDAVRRIDTAGVITTVAGTGRRRLLGRLRARVSRRS